ncbi:carbohydrate ABC transporter permease [Paenibacillus sp. GCM10012307]|uniref:Carbohydrate ABC transporter permease n=1 Tax=Paenibacillus roseus TaxID=2798579 RepID=A0A934J8K4_9BACL|nr:carbohydrate ABC transporter permease [Paenibacillus roseus]MBJ6362676.1 carbohydrate ABC transporter permease [Paenibacillus roseus]
MRWIKELFLYLVSFIMLAPFVWLIIASFKTNRELFAEPFGLPENWMFDNYIAVMTRHPVTTYFLNSVIVSVVSTLLALLLATLASYIFTYTFRWRSYWQLLLVGGILVPTNAFMVPYYFIVKWIGFYDSLFGIALVYAGISLPLSVLIIKNYMNTIPPELSEAAFIDGAGVHRTFTRIILPLSCPGVVTASIFLMVTAWNELMYANLLTQSEGTRTLQVAIRFFLTTFQANYPQAFAAMILAIVPSIVIYALLSEKIIGGLTAGAVK